MANDAVLTERKAREVIRVAGYKVVSFKEGAPPKLTAWLFQVREFEHDGRASVESGLRDDLKDADRVAVDSLGRATVVVSGDVGAAREAIHASLKKRGLTAEGFETKSWPKLDATYVVAVSGMSGDVEARTVASVLNGVAKVVAVHVREEAGEATLWLKEPCDALDANVRAALTSAGFPVSRVELVQGSEPPPASK